MDYGPVKGRCKKGYIKNKTTKMCEYSNSSINSKDTCEVKLKNITEKYNKLLTTCNKTKKIKKDQEIKEPFLTILNIKDQYGPTTKKCKKGYTKDKKTMMCRKKTTKKQENLLTIKDSTPKEDIELVKTVNKTPFSYSPEINNLLISKHKGEKENLFGNCLTIQLYEKKTKVKNIIIPKIWVKDKNKCMRYDNKEVINILLENLSRNQTIPAKEIIAPKQYLANCWFNTLYMIFFISDKGRKFFKFFRQFMITGKTISGKDIPKNIWKTLSLLNLAIESTLTGNKQLLFFDTNSLIAQVQRDIKKNKLKTSYKDNIYKLNEPGNPFDYYKTLMHYLGDGYKIGIPIYEIDLKKIKELIKNKYIIKEFIKKGYPEVLIIRLYQNENIHLSEKTIKLNNVIEYALDAAAVIDTTNAHFCCLITYDKQEYGFDGASNKRLNKFKWKKLINKYKEWTFSGSNFNNNPLHPIKWNFRNGYKELFYYRITK